MGHVHESNHSKLCGMAGKFSEKKIDKIRAFLKISMLEHAKPLWLLQHTYFAADCWKIPVFNMA